MESPCMEIMYRICKTRSCLIFKNSGVNPILSGAFEIYNGMRQLNNWWVGPESWWAKCFRLWDIHSTYTHSYKILSVPSYDPNFTFVSFSYLLTLSNCPYILCNLTKVARKAAQLKRAAYNLELRGGAPAYRGGGGAGGGGMGGGGGGGGDGGGGGGCGDGGGGGCWWDCLTSPRFSLTWPCCYNKWLLSNEMIFCSAVDDVWYAGHLLTNFICMWILHT